MSSTEENVYIEYIKIGLLYLIYLIVLYLFVQIFIPVLKFNTISNWWKLHDKDDLYSKQLDMISLAYWENFPLYYYLRILTTSERFRFESDSWVYFITSLIYGGGKDLVPGGKVTPYNLVVSLVPEGYKLSKTYGTIDRATDPKTFSIAIWRDLITQWGAIKINDKGTKTYTFDLDTWKANPDNFLYHDWSIPIDSPIIKAFVTTWSTDEGGDPIYPSALEPLLGFKNGLSSGGWLGFLQAGSGFKDMGVFEIKRQVWAISVPPNFSKSSSPPKGGCGSASSIASMATEGISTSLAAGMGGFMIAGPPGALVGGLIGLIVGGGLSATKQCT
jgi:hypothetical protein